VHPVNGVAFKLPKTAVRNSNSLHFSTMSGPKIIVVGAGIAGIAMGHTLKWKLGYNNFEVCNNCFASYQY
jgi:hypothetical protein